MCEKNDNDDNNNEEVGDISPFDIELDNYESNIGEVIVTPTLSVSAMRSISQPQTLKMFGYIKNAKLIGLVDSGSKHNFIDSRVAKQLNIFIYPTFDIQVSIRGTKTTSCGKKCHKVE